MKITLVKKILADGSPCKKCGEVLDRMTAENQLARIDEILVADERDPESAGMVLAKKLNIDRAPFFVVEKDNGETDVYTVYLKFVKDVLSQQVEEKDELKEILERNADLDFL